ncbi:MAG: VWA domain-containing protein [Candidatus Omnitrophica bacterium]|nr:VWA domain-containing protein [Candidatus Omnitrophota bacterium]
MNIIIRYPYFLIAIAAVPVFIVIVRLLRTKSSFAYPLTGYFKHHKFKDINVRNFVTPFLRFCAFSLILVALSQPLGSETEIDYESKGVDIILALDISGSMRAEDFQPDDRLKVAKEEARRFIQNRKHDRIGLVVFAGKSYTQCPLTLDYDILLDFLDQVQIGNIVDGTAIGLAIGNAVNRLLESEAKSKIIILLTDGENNAGQIDPYTAAEIARTMNIRIYTIGVGRGGLVPYPVDDPVFGRIYKNIRLDVDEETLRAIASATKGLYFRARDRKGLREIYDTIDELEKTEIKVKEYVNYQQLYQYPLLAALVFLLLEILIANTVKLKIP